MTNAHSESARLKGRQQRNLKRAFALKKIVFEWIADQVEWYRGVNLVSCIFNVRDFFCTVINEKEQSEWILKYR
jgi:hypothetical protein